MKYHAWFVYWCPECGEPLGTSSSRSLHHDSTKKEGKMFRKVTVPIKCSYAGQTFDVPKHTVELTPL